jgi:hypothetical protein
MRVRRNFIDFDDGLTGTRRSTFDPEPLRSPKESSPLKGKVK